MAVHIILVAWCVAVAMAPVTIETVLWILWGVTLVLFTLKLGNTFMCVVSEVDFVSCTIEVTSKLGSRLI